MSDGTNIGAALFEAARSRPDDAAIHVPIGRERDGRRRYRAHTYAELAGASDRIARGLVATGVGKGTRAALLVPPSFELFALVFGMFRAGVVPVMLDPGIGPKHLKACLAEAAPEAFIGVSKAHLARVVLRWARPTVKTLVTVGRRWLWGGLTLAEVEARGEASNMRLDPTSPEDLAAILFTSGSTGAPKGVEYRHRHFLEQVAMIRDCYAIEPGEVDLPTFPLFGLFDPALGMTTVLPDMDFTRPARLDAAHFVEIAQRFGATNMFGSPAVLDTLSRHGAAIGARSESPAMPKIRRVISAGAPVPGAVLERMRSLLPPGTPIHTPYGATENLPVATIASDTILTETWARTREGAGVCVGAPVPPNDVRVIRIDDGPVPQWSDELEVPAGTVGEITVLGPTTTEAYWARPEATKLAKIAHGGRVRHRMGDLGYVDSVGRIWFCGRKAHRVRTAHRELYTAQVEGIFSDHPGVRRVALVGVGDPSAQRAVVWVELEPGCRTPFDAIAEGLRARGATHAITAAIDTFLVHGGFPVDIRHNAKIGYEALAKEAAKVLAIPPAKAARRGA
jgi:acyl-CoA synthetase (AMP-forming)/AMP-acid ligase II